MTRGINEIDVHTAADELVAKGERPTVDRIRAHLGTGSPNTVTRWLETWWKNLGIRLQSKQPDLKETPAVLAELAGQWWALALEHARELVLQELSDARRALATEYDELRAQRQTFAEEASALHAKAEAAQQTERLAITQVVERQRLVDQLQAQVVELTQYRVSMDQRLNLTESARQALETRLQELQELARSERENLAEHIRSVEDRAMRDIDRARQEAKELQTKLTVASKLQATTERSLGSALDAAKDAAAKSAREADIQRARGDVLEEQLAKIPAALEAVFRKKGTSTTPKRRPRKA